MTTLAAIATGSMLLLGASSSPAQTGGELFLSLCATSCHGVTHPLNLVYNAAGNAAIIDKVNSLGMGAQGSSADFVSIAAYLDTAKPTITLAPVAHDSPGTQLAFFDIIVSKAMDNAYLKIMANVVTVTPPTKGTVTYKTGNGFDAPSYVVYTPFPGQSGIDTWTYQGIGNYGLNTTIRTASVMIAAAGGSATNYQGLWWVAGGAENFWGINFAHQGDLVFGTWYTYDTSGNVYWLSMLANRTTPTSNTYTGDINVDVGPPFNNFVGSGTFSKVGTGTLTFGDGNNGTFDYQLNAGTGGSPVAVNQTKVLTRFDLGTGPQPTCTFSATANLAAATNYQDLWWAASGSRNRVGDQLRASGQLHLRHVVHLRREGCEQQPADVALGAAAAAGHLDRLQRADIAHLGSALRQLQGERRGAADPDGGVGDRDVHRRQQRDVQLHDQRQRRSASRRKPDQGDHAFSIRCGRNGLPMM